MLNIHNTFYTFLLLKWCLISLTPSLDTHPLKLIVIQIYIAIRALFHNLQYSSFHNKCCCCCYLLMVRTKTPTFTKKNKLKERKRKTKSKCDTCFTHSPLSLVITVVVCHSPESPLQSCVTARNFSRVLSGFAGCLYTRPPYTHRPISLWLILNVTLWHTKKKEVCCFYITHYYSH